MGGSFPKRDLNLLDSQDFWTTNLMKSNYSSFGKRSAYAAETACDRPDLDIGSSIGA